MRIKKTDQRVRMWEHLKEATGKDHTSKTLDQAVRYYLRMHGSTHAYPTGVIDEVLDAAEDDGSLTAQQIANLLNVDELPVTYEISRLIGEE